jgi:hypothetical protein
MKWIIEIMKIKAGIPDWEPAYEKATYVGASRSLE